MGKGKIVAFLLLFACTVLVSGIDTRRQPVKAVGEIRYTNLPGPQLTGTVFWLERGGRPLTNWTVILNGTLTLARRPTGGYSGTINPYEIAAGNALKLDIWDPIEERISGKVMRTSPLISVRGAVPAKVEILSPGPGTVISLSRSASYTVRWRVTGSPRDLSLVIFDSSTTPPRTVLEIPAVGDSYSLSTAILQPDRTYTLMFAQPCILGVLGGSTTPDSHFMFVAVFKVDFRTVR